MMMEVVGVGEGWGEGEEEEEGGRRPPPRLRTLFNPLRVSDVGLLSLWRMEGEEGREGEEVVVGGEGWL